VVIVRRALQDFEGTLMSKHPRGAGWDFLYDDDDDGGGDGAAAGPRPTHSPGHAAACSYYRASIVYASAVSWPLPCGSAAVCGPGPVRITRRCIAIHIAVATLNHSAMHSYS
jgi:hypothetical protein